MEAGAGGGGSRSRAQANEQGRGEQRGGGGEAGGDGGAVASENHPLLPLGGTETGRLASSLRSTGSVSE